MGNGLTQPSLIDLLEAEKKKEKLGWYDILDSYIFSAVQTEDVSCAQRRKKLLMQTPSCNSNSASHYVVHQKTNWT